MKHLIVRLLSICLPSLIFVSLSQGQESSPKISLSRVPTTSLSKATVVVSQEEKMVRAAYDKLTMLSKAALLIRPDLANAAPDETLFLRFELRNFRVGPIQEILNTRHSEVLTGWSGEPIITLGRASTRINKEEEHVAYTAEWSNGQYASVYDRQWTIGDLLSYEPNLYFDVGEYTMYDVTVWFKGKTRSYRALALFHNQYGSVENLKPSFWDSVVGAGGSLTEVWFEGRPPVGKKVNLPIKSGVLLKERPISQNAHVYLSDVMASRRLTAGMNPATTFNPGPPTETRITLQRAIPIRAATAISFEAPPKMMRNIVRATTVSESAFRVSVRLSRTLNSYVRLSSPIRLPTRMERRPIGFTSM